MRLAWRDLGTPQADRAHSKTVEISGWPMTAVPRRGADYFLLTSDPACCAGCLPRNPLVAIEVFAHTLPSYADLPQLAAALRARFTAEETAKLLGGNYQRVFAASLA